MTSTIRTPSDGRLSVVSAVKLRIQGRSSADKPSAAAAYLPKAIKGLIDELRMADDSTLRFLAEAGVRKESIVRLMTRAELAGLASGHNPYSLAAIGQSEPEVDEMIASELCAEVARRSAAAKQGQFTPAGFELKGIKTLLYFRPTVARALTDEQATQLTQFLLDCARSSRLGRRKEALLETCRLLWTDFEGVAPIADLLRQAFEALKTEPEGSVSRFRHAPPVVIDDVPFEMRGPESRTDALRQMETFDTRMHEEWADHLPDQVLLALQDEHFGTAARQHLEKNLRADKHWKTMAICSILERLELLSRQGETEGKRALDAFVPLIKTFIEEGALRDLFDAGFEGYTFKQATRVLSPGQRLDLASSWLDAHRKELAKEQKKRPADRNLLWFSNRNFVEFLVSSPAPEIDELFRSADWSPLDEKLQRKGTDGLDKAFADRVELLKANPDLFGEAIEAA